VPSHQIKAFNILFKFSLADGGTYIIEDIEASFWKRGCIYGYDVVQDMKGNHHKAFDAMSAASLFINREFLSEEDVANLKRRMASLGLDTGICHEISSISFGHNCVIIKKATAEECAYMNRRYRLNQLIEVVS
jgi:hypothetical protein